MIINPDPFSSLEFTVSSPMRLQNIITQTQPQTSLFSGRLGYEERLKDFVFDGFGNAGTDCRVRRIIVTLYHFSLTVYSASKFKLIIR